MFLETNSSSASEQLLCRNASEVFDTNQRPVASEVVHEHGNDGVVEAGDLRFASLFEVDYHESQEKVSERQRLNLLENYLNFTTVNAQEVSEMWQEVIPASLSAHSAHSEFFLRETKIFIFGNFD